MIRAILNRLASLGNVFWPCTRRYELQAAAEHYLREAQRKKEGRAAMSLALHVIPVGGREPIHVAHSSCWCHPTPDLELGTGDLLIHNAKDLREVRERHPSFGGHPNGERWVHVYAPEEGELG